MSTYDCNVLYYALLKLFYDILLIKTLPRQPIQRGLDPIVINMLLGLQHRGRSQLAYLFDGNIINQPGTPRSLHKPGGFLPAHSRDNILRKGKRIL